MEIDEFLEIELANNYQKLIDIKDKYSNIVEVLDHRDGQKIVDDILKQPNNKNLLKEGEGYLFLLSNGMIFSFYTNEYFEGIRSVKVNSRASYLQGSLDTPLNIVQSFRNHFISQKPHVPEINFDSDKYKYPLKSNSVVIGFSIKIEEWQKHLRELESISGEIYRIIYPIDHFLKCDRDSSVIFDNILNHQGSMYVIFYSEEDNQYHYSELERRVLSPDQNAEEINVYDLIHWLSSSWYLTFNSMTTSRVTESLNELSYLYSCWISSDYYINEE